MASTRSEPITLTIVIKVTHLNPELVLSIIETKIHSVLVIAHQHFDHFHRHLLNPNKKIMNGIEE